MKFRFVLTAVFLTIALSTAGYAVIEPPVPQLPQVFIDTSWNPNTSGKSWKAHTSEEFKAALSSSKPGDSIVLDANTVYEGNFELPVKDNPNHKWIYIVSSGLDKLPAPGGRVSPANAVNMPKIVTPNATSAIAMPPGASFYRLVGLEIYSTSTKGCQPARVPPANCFSWNLVYAGGVKGKPLPDSLTIDRSFIHGSPTQDVGQGALLNGTNMAVIDSYFSDIHENTVDSQAILAYLTPGPIKIVNNYLSASTENVMIGGSGGSDNPWVPSDVEIRNNWFFKPLEWAQVGLTVPPHIKWSVKNSLEFKSARRVLVDGNLMENTWRSAQDGASVLFTIRSSASGDIAVVDDITFTNNVLKNVASGFATLASDFMCGRAPYTKCTNPGESKRIKIANNLILFRDAGLVGGTRNVGIQIGTDLSDYVLQHNSFVPAAGTQCWNSVYFVVKQGVKWPPAQSVTRNLWLLDNVLCRPPSGDWGGQGTAGLNGYMGEPAPLAQRFSGNIIAAPDGDKGLSFPPRNLLTKQSIGYTPSNDGDNRLSYPEWKDTTDGAPAGINKAKLAPAFAASGTKVSSPAEMSAEQTKR